MAHLSERQRIEILMMIGYGENVRSQKEVVRLFNNKYPDRSITQSCVSKIAQKFEEYGNVRDVQREGRPTVDFDKKLDILLEIEDNPNKSTRAISANHTVCHQTVFNVLQKAKYHPYKVTQVHELNEDDCDRRLEFCEVMNDKLSNQPDFLNYLIFSDEATFCLNGQVHRQNCRYWATENPHWMQESHTQNPQKLNVWAGFTRGHILGPYFFDGSLNGEMYLEFLRFELIPALAILFPNYEDPDLPSFNVWYQQDGAPPHYSLRVREYLDEVFPNRWIGRRGPMEWPARSPDLTPLDFFFEGI
jgi:hypothetical protein